MTKSRKPAQSKSIETSNQALTIYNSGFAVVQETRELKLQAGHNIIQIEGIPTQYVPSSLKVAESDDLEITGAEHQPATLTAALVLASLEGHDVELKHRTTSGKERWTSGTLLKVLNDKIIVSKATGRHALINLADIVDVTFEAAATEDLSETPTLVLSVDAAVAGAKPVRVLYHTRGISWHAVHSATYDDKAGKLTDFQTLASIDNRSGTKFNQARLTLLAGDVAPQRNGGFEASMAASPPMGGGRAKSVSSEAVGEQKIYPVTVAFSIRENQSRLVPLRRTQDVPVAREYFVPPMPAWQRASDSDAKAVQIRLRLTNNEENKLGDALPAGGVSIYQADSRGDLQLTGNDTLEHIADGETFGFVMGSSTDIRAERKMVARTPGELPGRTAKAEPKRFVDETWEVTVHNFKKDAAVEVSVIEDMPGRHEFLKKSHEFRSERADCYSATVTVPAGGKETLQFEVRFWAD